MKRSPLTRRRGLARTGRLRVLPTRDERTGKVPAKTRRACAALERTLNLAGAGPRLAGLVRRLPLRVTGYVLAKGLRRLETRASTKDAWRAVVPRTPLTRRKRLAPVTKDAARRKRRFARQYGSRARTAWYKAQPCVLRSARHICAYFPNRGRNEVCHILTRGSGRGLVVDGRPNTFTACPGGHDWQELRTAAMVKQQAGIDLWAVAKRQAAAFAAEGGR